MNPAGRRGQQGQILVMSAAVMAFLFVPLCVFVIDTGLVGAGHAQLGETLLAAAEDGASMIDEDAFRQSNGQQVVLDRAAAMATCERSLRASGMPGLHSSTCTVRDNTVTASARVRVDLLVAGDVTLSQAKRASFLYGS